MQEVIPLRYGTIFKKGFGDVEVFKAFVKAVIGIELEIDKVEMEKSFEPVIGSIDSRFDLFAEDKKHRIIVEIQHENNQDNYDHFLYYHNVALIEMTKNSSSYRPPYTLYTIVVQTTGTSHKEDVVTIAFDPVGRVKGHLGKIHHKVIFLYARHIKPDTPAAIREWLSVIEDSLDELINEQAHPNTAIQKLLRLVAREQLTPQEKARLIEDRYVEEAVSKLKEEQAKGQVELEAAQAQLKKEQEAYEIAQVQLGKEREAREIEQEAREAAQAELERERETAQKKQKEWVRGMIQMGLSVEQITTLTGLDETTISLFS